MLAKEIKIMNIKRQREFIKGKLEERLEHPMNDGDTSYRYVGHIFPDVIKYFNDEGYDVKPINSDMLTAKTAGLPIYLFTISDKVTLSEDEREMAEEVEYEAEDEAGFKQLSDMMESIFGGSV